MGLSVRSPVYLGLLGSFTALGPVATDMFLVSMPEMARHFGTSASAIQATLSVYFVGLAIGNILHGPLGDRYGRRPVMLGGLVVFTLATGLCLAAESVEQLLAGRFFQALGAQAAVVLARAVVRDVYPPARVPVAMSYLGMITAAAPVLAPIAGGLLQAGFGWQSNFYAMGGYALAAALILYVFFGETLDPAHKQSIRIEHILRNAGHILRNRAYLGFLGVLSFSFSGLFVYLSSSPFVYQGVFGLNEIHFGLVFGVLSTGILLGSLISSWFAARIGANRLLRFGCWLLLGAGSVMSVLALARVDHLLAMAGPQYFFMMGCGILFPLSFASALTPYPHMAGTASSLLGFFQLGLAGLAGLIAAQFLKVDPAPGDQIPMALAMTLTSVIVWISLQWSAAARRVQAEAG